MTSSVSAVDNQLYSLDYNDIETTTIIDAYNMLGFGLQKTMLLEIIAKVPEVKSLLFIALQFWRTLPELLKDPISKDKFIENPLILTKALATVSVFSAYIKIPKLKNLADLSLLYLLQVVASKQLIKVQEQNIMPGELVGITSLASIITDDRIFDELDLSLKWQTSEIENKDWLAKLLHQTGLSLAVEAICTLEQIDSKNKSTNNIKLLGLFSTLSMLLEDLNISMHINGKESKEIAEFWQNLTEQFIGLESAASLDNPISNLNDQKFITTAIPDRVIATKQQPTKVIEDQTLNIRTQQAIDSLNNNNYFKAAEELQDLLAEITKLDQEYSTLLVAQKNQVVLPPILEPKDKIFDIPKVTNNFETLNIKINKIAETWVDVVVEGNNLPNKAWKTRIHLATCPCTMAIPGFTGTISLTKNGKVVIEQLPANLNYMFNINGDLELKKLNINGRFNAKVAGTVTNNLCAAAGGILLHAKAVDNSNGLFITFNVPEYQFKELIRYLAEYRRIKTLLSQLLENSVLKAKLQQKLNAINAKFKEYKVDLESGDICIKTLDYLNNYHGNILSGNSCKLKHSGRLDNRTGTVASHSDATEILSLGGNGEVLSTNQGVIWAATDLQVKAPKIHKDELSIMQGLTSTNLRSFAGTLSNEGPIVSAGAFDLTQDRGFYKYSQSSLKAASLKVNTQTTSNILDKKIYTDQLEVNVSDPDGYTTEIAHKLLVKKQILLRLPSVTALQDMHAGKIAIHTPTYQLAEAQGHSTYTVRLNKKVLAKEVIITGHGVSQADNAPAIKAQKLGMATKNLHLTGGAEVANTALLRATGKVDYDPTKLKSGKWLGLHFSKVADFNFATKVPGSMYAKVLADDTPIDFPQEVLVQKHVVLDAPNSKFGSEEDNIGREPIKFHTGADGKILLLAKAFKLTKVNMYGDRGVALLASEPIECGTLEPKDNLEPSIVTNGALVAATNKSQDITLRHASITAMEGGLLQGKAIKHVGVKLNVGTNQEGLIYDGQPVADLIINRVAEPRARDIIFRTGFDNLSEHYDPCNVHAYEKYRNYINWDKIKTRRNQVNVGGKLNIVNGGAMGFSGSYVDLEHGDYTGTNHFFPEIPLRALVYNTGHNRHHHFRRELQDRGLFRDGNYEYVYDTIKPIYNVHGSTRFTVMQPITIDYNFVAEQVDFELGDNKIIAGRNLALAPPQRPLELTLIKPVEILPKESYIRLVPTVAGIFTYQPIFDIAFNRPNLDIVVLNTNYDYKRTNPINCPLSHPFVEMKALIETIKDQLYHKQVGNTGLTDKEIYYYMLANAVEHASTGKPFLEDTVIKPMLVYKKQADGSVKPVSLLPKILDIPELRANVGGVFCRLLKAHGTANSAIDLLGAIVTKEGYKIDIGRLAILQQYRENQRIIWNEQSSRNCCGHKKTSITSSTVTERTAVENTGLLKTIKGNSELNLVEFKARGGSLVCLEGNTLVRVRDLVDLNGLVNINYQEHSSSACTVLKKCSTKNFVQRQQIVPFKLITPKGTITILCDNEVHATAIQVLAKSGYIYGKNLIELEANKLWQELGPTHAKKGMMLSTTHGSIQTAAPCSFILEENMLFETSATGAFRDTGSQFFTGSGVQAKASSVDVKPVQLESHIYRKSSGLLGFAYVKEKTTEQHKTHQGSNYNAITGDIVFNALSKDVTACAITARAPQGKAKFIADQGKVNILQATDEHNITTDTRSIGCSFMMSDAIINAMRGDFSKAIQNTFNELQAVNDVNGLLHAEGAFDKGVKGITAAHGIVKSLLLLNKGGLLAFLAGNLSPHMELTFNKKHKTVNFGEIVGNWLLAKEIIIQAKQEVAIQATDAECKNLHVKSETSSITVDGGTANGSSEVNSNGTTVGWKGKTPSGSVQKEHQSSSSTTHGMSHFKVTGEAYISAVKGDIVFRNAVLQARRAYIEALRLKLETERDEVIEKTRKMSVGTNLNYGKTDSTSRWVQEQTGISVSEDLTVAIEQSTALIGSFIEVGSEAVPLVAKLPNGEAKNLYALLFPEDSESGFKVLGVPRAKAICQLFEVAEDIEFRAMLAPEIMQQYLAGNLPETITPPNPDLPRAELLVWASSQECYENYLGFYLALESTPLLLNKRSDIGVMAAIAKINKLNLRIWGKTSDEQLHWSTEHNSEGGSIVNIAVMPDGNYTRLSDKPGMLISSTFSYSDVESSYDSKEQGFSVDGAMFGDMVGVGKAKIRNVKERQTNFAHLSSNINLQSNDSGPTSSVKRSEVSSKKRTFEVDTNLPNKVGDLAAGLGSLKEIFSKYDPEMAKATTIAKETLEKEKLELERQEQEKLKQAAEQQTQQNIQTERRQEITASWLDKAGLFNGILSFYEPKNRRVIDNNDLVESQAVQQKQSSFMSRVGSSVADFFMPAAYADDGIEQSSGQDASIPGQQIPRKRFSLQSTLPTNSENKFLNYSYSVGIGIEHARDATADLVVHPIDNTKELATMSWDGYNAISGLLFGYSNANSRARNIERGGAIIDSVAQADGAKIVEVGTEIVASTVLGAAIGVAAGKGLREAYKAGKKSYYVNNFDKALPHPSTKGHVFSKTKAKKPGEPRTKPKDGHVDDTFVNRKNMIETFADPKRNFVFEELHGQQTKQTLARILPDNTESWVHVEKGKMTSAGANESFKYFNTDGTLQAKYSGVARAKYLQNTVETVFETTVGAVTANTKNKRNQP